MRPGLVSITFRQLLTDEIIARCSESGLRAIEWGGDVHVPSGDTETAKRVADATCEAGLSVSAYGSYFRLGASSSTALAFSTVLETAVALGAPVIRVWAGNRASSEADSDWRRTVAADALLCANLAAEHGIAIAYEFHGGTLTDTLESALALLVATDHPFIRTLWQPPIGSEMADNLTALRMLAPRLAGIHAFNWGPMGWSDRRPLVEARTLWQTYIGELRTLGFRGDVMLEFVPGDDPEILTHEAAELHFLLSGTD
jgi:3-dehydroshikimate dehydratase